MLVTPDAIVSVLKKRTAAITKSEANKMDF
jgi:hypothetical protein